MMTLLIFQAHFFCLCNTCLFVTFGTSSNVSGPNIIQLYSSMASKSIRYSNSETKNWCLASGGRLLVIVTEPLHWNRFEREINVICWEIRRRANGVSSTSEENPGTTHARHPGGGNHRRIGSQTTITRGE